MDKQLTSTYFLNGDLLDCHADYIVHQVNCRGVAGAGLALAIRRAVPGFYDRYINHCRDYAPASLLGRAFIYKHVISVFGQLNYGRNRSVVYTDYNALKRAFNAIQHKLPLDKSIAFPYMFGCGLANGNWDTVLNLIRTCFPGRTVYIVKNN